MNTIFPKIIKILSLVFVLNVSIGLITPSYRYFPDTLPLNAKEKANRSNQMSFVESTKYFDVNRIRASVHNNGIFARQKITGNSDFKFDGASIIYTSGFWMAAIVNGEVRASAADYNTDYVGGAIDDQGNPYGKQDSLFRVYKITRGDNSQNNPDYAEWPGQLGAPTDINGNPLLIGDQTLWCSFTDAFVEERTDYNICPPLGAEIHLTVWGWQNIDNVMFLNWEIINKSNNTWEDAYFGIYSDPDIMDAYDELTASDSTLYLAYCYDTSDQWTYTPFHSVGYQMLASPIVPSQGDVAVTMWGRKENYRNIDVYSPRMEKNLGATNWNDVDYLRENTAQQIYNRLQYLDRNGNPEIDPVTNLPARWSFSGDPFYGTGWLDDLTLRDRRMMISTGPITMAPGDSNSITTAIFPVRRNNRLSCVYDLKKQAQALQSTFRKSVGIYPEMVITQIGETNVQFPIKMLNLSQVQQLEFTFEFESNSVEFVKLFPTGRASDFLVDTQFDSINKSVHVVMEKTNNYIVAGNDTIANVIFNIKHQVDSSLARIKINDINVIGDNSIAFEVEPVDGIIKIERLPDPPRLFAPINNQYIDGLGVNFLWSKTSGSDSNIYVLDLNESFINKTVSDTSLSLNIREFVLREDYPQFVDWTVKIANYGISIHSPDTFRFQLPPIEKLNFAKQLYTISIPDEPDYWLSIEDYYFLDSYFYVFVANRNTTNNQTYFRLLVFELLENSAQLINSQEIDYDYSDSFFQIKGNYAFVYANYYLKTYLIENDKKFSLQKSVNLYFNPHAMELYENYLVFSSLSKIIIYRIDNIGEIHKINEYDISDWQIPDSGSPQHIYNNVLVIKENCLFFAQGDWGIFDISVPESLKLISRNEIPGLATTIDADNGCVVVGSADNWLGVYDISAKNNPILLHAERFNDLGIGKAYNKISLLKVIDGFIYFENWGLVGLLVCHYEPGKYFILDGVQNPYDPLITSTKIFSKSGNEIKVFQNQVVTSVEEKIVPEPIAWQLFQNFPNPFNSSTKINFYLNQQGEVELKIYNIQGQLVKVLVNEFRNLGMYQIFWDGTDQIGQPVASGLYFYQLKNRNKILNKKMIYIK